MTPKVVLSYGLGVDSTAILLRWLLEPATRDFDLDELLVVTAMTGHEWPVSGTLVETHILPLLRHYRVRYVQAARRTARTTDVKVLDDSREPLKLYLAGAYTLSDELLESGTVPQSGGEHMCSMHAKGEVLDELLAGLTEGRPFLHAMGYEANEPMRAARDALHNTRVAPGDTRPRTFREWAGRTWAGSPKPPSESGPQLAWIDAHPEVVRDWKRATVAVRTGIYPLLDWRMDRASCERYIRAVLHVDWPKSACSFCPFAMGPKNRADVIARFRREPEEGLLALLLDHVSVSLNPAQPLVPGLDLYAAVEAAAPELARQHRQRLGREPYALYEVQRTLKPAVTRRVATIDTGSQSQMNALLAQLAGRELEVDDRGIHRWWLRRRMTAPEGLSKTAQRKWLSAWKAGHADGEHLFVTAPAVVRDKTNRAFDAAWTKLEAEAARKRLPLR